MRRLLSNSLGLLGLLLGAAAHASLLETSTYDNLVYFADDQSNQLQRYSLATESFLTPITLSQNPKAIHVDAAGIYVSYGTQVVKLALDGTNQTAVRTTSKIITDIEATDKLLFLAGTGYLQVANKTNNTLIDSRSEYAFGRFISLANNGAELYTTNTDYSPTDLYQISINADGTIKTFRDTPYHGNYAVLEQPRKFPNSNRVIDTSGNIYNTGNLNYVTNLGGAYTTLDFWQGLPVVLRNGQLYGYNLQLQETGHSAFSNGLTLTQLVVHGNKAFGFGLDNSNNLVAESMAISQLNLSTPPASIDPTGLAFKPDQVVLDADQDTVYLLSKFHFSIFRWSISQQRYLATINLMDIPESLAYLPAHGRIYVSYYDGRVNYVDLDNDAESSLTIANTRSPVLVSAGNFLFIQEIDPWGSWGTKIKFALWDKAGQRTEQLNVDYSAPWFQWDDKTSSIYYGDSYYNLIFHRINDDGTFGERKYRPMIVIYQTKPVQLSENHKFAALATGEIYATGTIGSVIDLNSTGSFTDIVWLHGNLFSIKGVDENTYTHLDRWLPGFTRDATAAHEVLGEPLALLPLPQADKLVLITLKNAIPDFEVLNVTEADFDGDGVVDSIDLFPADAAETVDLDLDGIGDNSDPDQDGDGTPNTSDRFPRDSDESLDSDNDGIGNNADTDDDNDGVADINDEFPLDPAESEDLDWDGIGNNADTDKDGDGVSDIQDRFPLDSTETLDFDNDGIGNNVDDDDDNDGVDDWLDAYPYNPAESADTDWDGIGDNADPDRDNDGIENDKDAFPLDRYESMDSDNDGWGNNNDSDDDNDGVNDWYDAFPFNPAESKDADGDGIADGIDPDIDGDGVLNSVDAFPTNWYEKTDSDKDGIGDNSDTDDDNDGIPDYIDRFPLNPLESADSDNDGIGDNVDDDRDGDGVKNTDDFRPNDPSESLDSDKDGIGNSTDLDDDNDGVSDFQDYYPLDATKSALGDVARFLPMAKSNQWVYDISGGTVTLGADKKIADQTINPISFPAGGKLYLKVVDNQVRFYGLYLPTVYTDFGSFSLDFSMDKGVNLLSSNSSSGRGSVNISPTYGKRDLTWNTQVTYLGSEQVVVPAGNYSALHTRIYFSGSATVDGVPVSIEYQSDFWFADGVGLVKIINQGAELKLTSSKITAETPDNGGNTGGNTGGGNSGGGSTDGGKKGGGGGSTSLLLLALLGLYLPLRKKAGQA
ncbi:MAG: hypothetical protein B0W54_15425 [Cellvibrio sp. 79]|nr:MAG: hypothetical protein B0W54_15425 [Cellvibrio sp. 79]